MANGITEFMYDLESVTLRAQALQIGQMGRLLSAIVRICTSGNVDALEALLTVAEYFSPPEDDLRL